MGNILLAIGMDNFGNAVSINYGTVPWSGINKAIVQDIINNSISIDNIRMTDKNELICLVGDIKKYTTVVNGEIQKRSYVVLAKAKDESDQENELYFITDGLTNPTWLRSTDVKEKIFKEKYRFANAELNIDLNKLEPINKEFIEVKYIEFQREYKRFLKQHFNE